MLRLIISRTGYGKTRLIHDRIKQLVNDNKDVALIIPEQISFESEKDVLKTVGAVDFKKVSVMSFTRFCSKFFEEYGGREKPYIDAVGKTALMQEVLKKLTPSLCLFKKSAAIPQFCETMIELDSTIKMNSITPELLSKSAEANSGILQQKLIETSLILAEYQELLNRDYYDPLDDLTVVAKRLKECPFFKNKTVFIDSFTGFTAQQMSVIEQIIKCSENTYISLGFDGVYSCNSLSTFSNMAKTALDLKRMAKENSIEVFPDEVLTENYRYENDELDFLEKNIFSNESNQYNEECNNIFITCVKNIYEEAEYVAKTILNLVRTSNLRYREISVISRDANQYNGIIDEIFERYDIPLFIDDREGVENLSLFKLVSFALSAVYNKFDYDSIISLIKTGLTDVNDSTVSLFELYTAVWRINKKDFLREFNLPVDTFINGDSEYLEKSLRDIESARKIIIEPLVEFNKNRGNTAKSYIIALYKLIKSYNCDKNLKIKSDEFKEKGYIRLSESTIRSYEIMIHILDQLYLSLDDTAMDLKRFCDIFSSAVALIDIGSLPQGLDAVAVGSAERMRPKSPKVTFVVGANEGVFPSSKSGIGLFSDSELSSLKEKGINLPFYDIDTAVDEQYLAYCAVCSPSEKLYVSYSSGSLSMELKEPSEIVSDILRIFPKLKVKKYDNSVIESINDAIKSFAVSGGKDAELKKFFENHPNTKFTSVTNAFQNNIKKLKPETAEKLYGKNIYTSASKIETFNKCRFYYFCKYGLKAKPIREARVDNLSRGSLVHFVLEKMINTYSVAEFLKLSNDEVSHAVYKFGEEFLKTIIFAKEQTSVEKYRFLKLCDMITELVIRVFNELEQSEYVPVKTELSIGGEKPDIPFYKVEFDKGNIILSGFVDRVDAVEKNGKKFLRIIDYKTGLKKINLSDMYFGQNIQMPLYMKAVIDNGKDAFGECLPGGMFYFPAKEATISADREENDNDISEKRIKSVKMDGIFLGDETSYLAIEPSGKGLYSPVKLKNDGSLSSSAPYYTLEQYNILSRFLDLKLKDTAQKISDGEINPLPVDGVGSSACDYCDYSSVCKFKGEHEKITKLANDEVFTMMNEEIKREKEGEK